MEKQNKKTRIGFWPSVVFYLTLLSDSNLGLKEHNWQVTIFTQWPKFYEMKPEVCTIPFIEINWGKYRISRGEIMEAEQLYPWGLNTPCSDLLSGNEVAEHLQCLMTRMGELADSRSILVLNMYIDMNKSYFYVFLGFVMN